MRQTVGKQRNGKGTGTGKTDGHMDGCFFSASYSEFAIAGPVDRDNGRVFLRLRERDVILIAFKLLSVNKLQPFPAISRCTSRVKQASPAEV